MGKKNKKNKHVENQESVTNTDAANTETIEEAKEQGSPDNNPDSNTTEILQEEVIQKENDKKEIFVLAEICCKNNSQYAHSVAYELISQAKNLALDNFKVSVLYPCENFAEEIAKSFFKEGADKIYHIKLDKNKNCEYLPQALINIIKEKEPEIVLIGATNEGRLIAPLISSTLKTGLTADCTKLEMIDFKGETKLAATRPTFGGQLMATILCKTFPQMVTVRAGVLSRNNISYAETGEIEEYIPDFKDKNQRIKLVDYEEIDIKKAELENAKVVVAGGAGLKNKEGFDKLKEFADLIGASIAGSRKAVDMMLIEKDNQVGQTGKTIAPEIYFAVGISGAIHHLSGMQNSSKVIAINNDPNAPIFSHADYGIIGDAAETLDKLIDDFKKD